MKKTLASIAVERKLTPYKTVTTKRELVFSKNPETACTIPVGTQVLVHFSEERPAFLYFEYAGSVRATQLQYAHRNFTGFKAPPQMETIWKWHDNGLCKTVTGMWTEPDGFGTDGSPSWLMALGLI